MVRRTNIGDKTSETAHQAARYYSSRRPPSILAASWHWLSLCSAYASSNSPINLALAPMEEFHPPSLGRAGSEPRSCRSAPSFCGSRRPHTCTRPGTSSRFPGGHGPRLGPGGTTPGPPWNTGDSTSRRSRGAFPGGPSCSRTAKFRVRDKSA